MTNESDGMAGAGPLVRDVTLLQQVEVVVRDMILDGRIAPGARLNEVGLAATLGVSRGPLREAIQRLASEGLVTVVSRRGSFVRTFERREIEELYDIRCAHEMLAARLVCERATDAQLERFGEFVLDTGAAMGQSDARYPRDRDFHHRLIALAEHTTLSRVASETQAQISLARSISGQAPDRAKEALTEHLDIVKALQVRDAEAAMRLVQAHLEHACRGAIAALGVDHTQNGDNR